MATVPQDLLQQLSAGPGQVQLPSGGFGSYSGGGFDGYGASGSWAPVPTTPIIQNSPSPTRTSVPTPTPTPSPTPQQSDGFTMDAYKGWDEASARADWNAKGRPNLSSNIAGGVDMNAQIEAIYGPLNSILDQYSNQLKSDQSLDLEEADLFKTQQERSLQGQADTSTKNRDFAQQSLEASARSAYEQAIRDYAALRQQGQSRFGMDSSAGQAVSEITSQEFLRGQAAEAKSKQEGINQIFMAWTAVQDSVAENKTKLDETMRIEAKKIGQIYDQRRLELQAKRFENESAKKAANFQLLQQSMAESQNLKSMRDQAAIQLDAWKNQMQESIKMGLVKLQSQTEVAPSVRPETFQPTYGKTQQQNVPQAYRTTVPVGDDISGLTGNQDEWLKGVLNPFGV